MADLDALGRARRARREEDIGRGIRRHALQPGAAGIGVEVDLIEAKREGSGSDRRDRVLLADDAIDAGARRDLAQAFGRLADVERNIGMARLHDAEQADGQRARPVDGDGDSAVPHGARLQQRAGERGRPAVELGVGQRSGAVAARHALGRPRGLRGEQVVEAAFAGIGRVGVVDDVEHETRLLGR